MTVDIDRETERSLQKIEMALLNDDEVIDESTVEILSDLVELGSNGRVDEWVSLSVHRDPVVDVLSDFPVSDYAMEIVNRTRPPPISQNFRLSQRKHPNG